MKIRLSPLFALFSVGVTVTFLYAGSCFAGQTVIGDYLQLRSSPALDEPLRSEGRFYFNSDVGLLWADTGTEVGARFVQAEGSSFEFAKGEWQKLNKSSAEVQRLIQMLLEQDEQRLAKKFDMDKQRIEEKPGPDGESAENESYWQIQLKPRQRRIARHINGIVIIKKHYLESLKITWADTSRLELQFSKQYSPPEFRLSTCEAHFSFESALCDKLVSK